MPRGAAQCWW